MATPTAATTSGLLNLEKELVCFICTEVLYQPLTLIDCLHTFCGSCLKEWFSHQHRKASHLHTPPTHPYTCPTCRATVKDVQHNAMINTLLDMFLAANPEKHRSPQEKTEMSQIYKPGENILPKVEPRKRERRRRDEDDTARRERRPADDTRDRSRRDGQSASQPNDRLAPHTSHERSRSRGGEQDGSRDRRLQDRQERQQRREMRERLEAAEARVRDQGPATVPEGPTLSPPSTSPRHPDAVEARSRATNLVHQASIRSLVSASDSGTGTGDSLNEAQLMQEILSEGLLDGINIDELTEAEQDQLSETIAERYRQLHPQRTRRTDSGADTARAQSANTSSDLQESQLEAADRPGQASRGGPRREEASPRSTSNASHIQADSPPITSHSHTSQREQTLSPPRQDRARHRRFSDQSAREDASRTHRSTHPGTNQASRSSTDLSDGPRTDEPAAADGPQRLSNTGRAQTEPRQGPTASELWTRGGVVISRSRAPQTDAPAQTSPLAQGATPATTSSAVSQAAASSTVPPEADAANDAPMKVRTSFEEPEVSCHRCQRKGIQYEVYKHCSACDVDLCLRCYRSGRGCNHWFGFGHAALARFDASHPRSRGSQQIKLPHLLIGRQFRKPPADSLKAGEGDAVSSTSSDPASRLQEGHFCDRCGNFANSCFWTCDYCNDGEWGFCNSCVATHHCCTHPLLPMAHKDFAPGSPFQLQPVDPFSNHLHPTPGHSAPSSATSAVDLAFGPLADFVQLSITTHCDICTQPIPPPQSRYHCPSHPTPAPQAPQSKGDYDICTSCYHNLIKIGRMQRNDGPAGWRKCPNGHRMIVTNFETDSEGGQRRVVVSDLVGGVKMTEEHVREWSESMARVSEKDKAGLGASGQLALSRGQWTWHDPAEGDVSASSSTAASEVGGHRRTKSRQATITPSMNTSAIPVPTTSKQSFSNPKFPPNGGFGKSCLALWSYFPEDGDDGKGELMFPKGAEVREVENINEDWEEGVYAGVVGLVPRVYLRDLVA